MYFLLGGGGFMRNSGVIQVAEPHRDVFSVNYNEFIFTPNIIEKQFHLIQDSNLS